MGEFHSKRREFNDGKKEMVVLVETREERNEWGDIVKDRDVS